MKPPSHADQLANAHKATQAPVSLLRKPDLLKARRSRSTRRGLHVGGGDRDRCHRSVARPAAAAGDHRGHRRAARAETPDLTEVEVRDALAQLDPLWEELLPAEQARIVRLLVERVEVGPDGADIRLRVAGLTSLMRELRGSEDVAQRAA